MWLTRFVNFNTKCCPKLNGDCSQILSQQSQTWLMSILCKKRTQHCEMWLHSIVVQCFGKNVVKCWNKCCATFFFPAVYYKIKILMVSCCETLTRLFLGKKIRQVNAQSHVQGPLIPFPLLSFVEHSSQWFCENIGFHVFCSTPSKINELSLNVVHQYHVLEVQMLSLVSSSCFNNVCPCHEIVRK